MELNKIFAAILVAGIIASFSGFVSKKIVHPHELEENAVKIDVPEVAAAGGTVKEALPEPVLAMLGDADIARGEKIAKSCAACHSFDKGGNNGVGPNLYGVVGAKKQAKAGFSYSGALDQKGPEWDYAALNKFLWKPKWYAPGTKMNYLGLKKPEDRAAVIAWLHTLSDSPIPMPTDAQIAAEQAELSPTEAETEKGSQAAGEETGSEETNDTAMDKDPANESPAGNH